MHSFKKLTGEDVFSILELEEPDQDNLFDLYLIAEATNFTFDEVLDWEYFVTQEYNGLLNKQLLECGKSRKVGDKVHVEMKTPGFEDREMIFRAPLNRDRLNNDVFTMRKRRLIMAVRCSNYSEDEWRKLDIGDVMNCTLALNFFRPE